MEEKKNKRGRPKKESVMETIAVRLPFEIILEIDNYVNQIKKRYLQQFQMQLCGQKEEQQQNNI